MEAVEIIRHIPPVRFNAPQQTAEDRLAYIKEAGQAFMNAVRAAADASPWLLDEQAIKHAQLCAKDIIDDLFYHVSRADREEIEEQKAQEAREQREHERIESEFVRRF